MKNRKQFQAGFGALELLLIVVVIALIVAVGWIFIKQKDTADSPKNTSSSSQNKADKPVALEKGTFDADDEAGSVQVEGFATTKKVNEDPYCKDDCKTNDYVLFTVTRTENDDIYKYIKSLEGNSFVEEKAIGLGCAVDGTLRYHNVSDEAGNKQYTISNDDTSKILNSTADKPIVLGLEKLKVSGGADAPSTCYSHFTKIDVL